MVAIGEHFLRAMGRKGVPVILCGVRPDLERTVKDLRFAQWLPEGRVFPSDPMAPGSSTVASVRKAYDLVGAEARSGCPHCAAVDPAAVDLYYMV